MLTSAALTSLKYYLNCKGLQNNQKRSVSRRDGDIDGKMERQLSSGIFLARSLSGLTFLNRLEMPQFNMIQDMLHSHGQACDSSCRFVAPNSIWRRTLKDAQIAVNDITKFAFALESLTSISEMICRYDVFERLYLRYESPAADALKRAMVRLYAAILVHLAKTKSYFDQNSASQ